MKKIFLLIFLALFFSGCSWRKNTSSIHVQMPASFTIQPALDHLPFLNIKKLKRPIHNVVYEYNGSVTSMDSYEKILVKKLKLNSHYLGKVSRKIMGSCLSFTLDRKNFCITYVNSQYSPIQQWASAVHEEMHVVQMLNIQEAYEILQSRLGKQNFHLDLKKLSIEDQACAATILLILENNLSMGDVFPQNHQQIRNLMKYFKTK